MDETRSRSGGFAHSLRQPGFRRLYASATTSTLGAAISLVSVSWIVYHFTGSSIDIAYLGLTGIVPGVVLGLLAGVIADRYNRRSLMVASDLVRMGGMGLLTAAFLVGGFSLPLVLAVMTLVSCFSAIFTPASQAMVPRLVADGSLEDANGLLQSSVGIGWSAGSAVGGLLVVFLGAEWGLGLNAFTYALSALFLVQIASELGRPNPDPTRPRRSFRRDLVEGWQYVFDHPPLFAVGFGYLPVNFLSALVTPFLVVYAATRFGGSALVFGLLAATLAGGSAAGALAVGRVRVRRRAGLAMGVCLLIEGGSYLLLAVATNPGVSLLAILGTGLTIGFANTVYYSTVQATVPGTVLGRVLSIGDFGSFVAIPAGLVVGGVLIAIYGVGVEYLFAGLGILACALVLLSLPSFRSFGRASVSTPVDGAH